MAIENDSPGTSWTEEMVRRVLVDAYMQGIIWKAGNEVWGYCVFGLLAPTLEILNIVVDTRHRRHGIARQILEAVIAKAKSQGCTEVFLEVRVSNTAAFKLYESLGFKIIHTRKHYYRDGEDGFVMGATT